MGTLALPIISINFIYSCIFYFPYNHYDCVVLMLRQEGAIIASGHYHQKGKAGLHFPLTLTTLRIFSWTSSSTLWDMKFPAVLSCLAEMEWDYLVIDSICDCF